jgi:hypothetical protein
LQEDTMSTAISSRLRALAVAVAFTAAPAMFSAQAQTTGTASSPGIAGPANPASFSATGAFGVAGVGGTSAANLSATTRVGIAGPIDPFGTSLVSRPGIAGAGDPMTFSATARVGIAGFSPLLPGLALTTTEANVGVVDPNAFPPLPGAFSQGITGIDPMTFSAVNQAGVAGRALTDPVVTPASVLEPVDDISRTRPVVVGDGVGGGTGTVVGFSPRPVTGSGTVITNRDGRVTIVRGRGN